MLTVDDAYLQSKAKINAMALAAMCIPPWVIKHEEKMETSMRSIVALLGSTDHHVFKAVEQSGSVVRAVAVADLLSSGDYDAAEYVAYHGEMPPRKRGQGC